MPITYRVMPGNAEDSTTHIATRDRCQTIAGTPSFLYVADSKLATHENVGHIATNARRLTIVPRTRKEDETGRAWIASGGIDWVEVSRRAGKRKDDPDEVYWSVPAPSCSAEGYRIVWFCSSSKRVNGAASRIDRIERARAGLCEFATSPSSPRSRLKSRLAAEDAAKKVVVEANAVRWVRFEVTDEVVTEFRQERRG